MPHIMPRRKYDAKMLYWEQSQFKALYIIKLFVQSTYVEYLNGM